MFARLTFQTRLILSFLLLVLLMLSIAFAGYRFYRKRDAMGSVFGMLEQIGVKTLQMIDYEKDFFLYDAVDSHFFQTNESEYLSEHKKLRQNVEADLKLLELMSQKADYDILPDIDSIIVSIRRNDEIFSKTVNLIKFRGFRDFGLEGKMREYAHNMEVSPFIGEVQLLTLRRREKDYILRKDTIYVQMFDKTTAEVLQHLNTLMPTPAVEQARQNLLGYQSSFKALVTVEQQIGTDHFSGMKKQMREKSQLVQQDIRNTLQKTNRQFDQLFMELETTFGIIVAFATIFGFGLSYFMTRQLIKPIRKLSEHINELVEKGFVMEKKPTLLEAATQDEIGDLTRNFNVMTERIYQDLSEIYEKSKTLRIQNAELQTINFKLNASQNRLQSINGVKDKFLSIISHDVRGPLGTLTGFLEMLRQNSDFFSPEEMSDFADKMNISVRRVLSLMENLLQWSRSQTGDILPKTELLPLLPILEDNVNLLREVASRKTIDIWVEADPKTMVEADKNMLDFVLRNLISNAIKFTPSGGSVTVKSVSEFRFVRISVHDTGVGIESEDIEKIFKPDVNFSTPGTDKELGTGFGLLLCKDFVEKNGGELVVESSFNIGTTVTFTVPTMKTRVEIPVLVE